MEEHKEWFKDLEQSRIILGRTKALVDSFVEVLDGDLLSEAEMACIILSCRVIADILESDFRNDFKDEELSVFNKVLDGGESVFAEIIERRLSENSYSCTIIKRGEKRNGA